MFACFHYLAFPSQVSLYFLFILTPFPLLFGSFCLSWASQGRQDRHKSGPRPAKFQPRGAKSRPKTAPRPRPRAPQDSHGLQKTDLAPFCSLLLPFGSRVGFMLLLFGCFLRLFQSTFQQHAYSIPTAFPQHSCMMAFPSPHSSDM